MTRPRSLQINSPSVKLTSIVLPSPPSVDSPSKSYTSTIIQGLIPTGSVAGVGQDLPATKISNINTAITAAATDTFTVSVNGVPKVITLTASEIIGSNTTTPSLLAAKINSTIGSPVASVNANNYLVLKSTTNGSSSSIQVTDGTLTAAVLGFNTTITNGVDATVGLVTSSEDGLGGYAFLSSSDGNAVIANSASLYSLKTSTNEFVSDVVPNAPVYARVINSSANTVLGFNQRVFGNGPLLSSRSNFPALTGSETLEISVTDNISGYTSGIVSVTSLTAPTPAQVAAAINTAWGDRRRGFVVSRVSEPYCVTGTLELMVNGTSFTVTLDGSERLASDVATKINATISAQGSSTFLSISGRNFIKIQTTTTAGSTDCVEILNTSTQSVLDGLGFSVGLYKGSLLAFETGSEVKLVPPCPSATISFGATTDPHKALFGFRAADTTSTLREIPVAWPQLPANASSIVAKVTEFMEFGQIPETADESNELAALQSLTPFMSPDELVGARKSGQLVSRTATGDLESGGSADFLNGRVGAVTFPTQDSDTGSANPRPAMAVSVIDDNVTPILEGIKADGSVRILSNDLSDISAIALTSNAEYDRNANNWKADVAHATANPASILQLEDDTLHFKRKADTATAWTDSNWTKVISTGVATGISGIDQELAIHGTTSVLRGNGSSLKITDANIDDDSTQKYIEVSDASAGVGLRVGNIVKNAGTGSNSLLKSVNGRAYISIGDGADTFGDFNGVAAFQDALAFVTTHIDNISAAVIRVKAGEYKVNVSITLPNCDIEIVGDSAASTTITTTATVDCLIDSTDAVRLRALKNLTVKSQSVTAYGLKTTKSSIVIDGCDITGLYIGASATAAIPNSCVITNSTIRSGGTSYAALDINPGETVTINGSTGYAPISVSNSHFICNATQNNRCIFITGIGGTDTAGQKFFSSITFNNCIFDLASCTVNSNPSPTRGTGLFELNPQNNANFYAGLVVKSLIFQGCTVNALENSNTSYLLMCVPMLNSYATPVIPALAKYGWAESLSLMNNAFSVRLPLSSESNTIASFVLGDGAKSVVMENNTINYISGATSIYGDLPLAFTHRLSTSNYFDYEANIVLSTPKLSLKNLTVSGALINGAANKGFNIFDGLDLWINQGLDLDVDTISVSYSMNGNSFIPDTRVFISIPTEDLDPIWDADQEARGVIRNLRLIGETTGVTKEWVKSSFVTVASSRTLITGAIIKNFGGTRTAPHVNVSGIKVRPLYDGSALFTEDITIDDCSISGMPVGIAMAFDQVTDNLGNITISNNRINAVAQTSPALSGEYAKGISLWIWNPDYDHSYVRSINGNNIRVDGPGYGTSTPVTSPENTSAGIWTGVAMRWTGGGCSLKIENNYIFTIKETSNHIPGIFIAANANSVAGCTPSAIVVGNSCVERDTSSDGVGYIQAMAVNGLDESIAINGTYNYSDTSLIGMQTNVYNSTTTAPDWYYTSLRMTMSNHAYLLNADYPGKL